MSQNYCSGATKSPWACTLVVLACSTSHVVTAERIDFLGACTTGLAIAILKDAIVVTLGNMATSEIVRLNAVCTAQ